MKLAPDLKFLATVDRLLEQFETAQAVSLIAMSLDRAQRRNQAAMREVSTGFNTTVKHADINKAEVERRASAVPADA